MLFGDIFLETIMCCQMFLQENTRVFLDILFRRLQRKKTERYKIIEFPECWKHRKLRVANRFFCEDSQNKTRGLPMNGVP